jgi:hypothetical protein
MENPQMVTSEPMETPQTVKDAPVQLDSNPPRRTDREEVHGSSTFFLQRRIRNLDFLRALQNGRLAFSGPNSFLTSYPNAAEASATAALLQSLLGLPSRTPQLYEGDTLSQLAAPHFPSYARPTMQEMQYMSSIRFYGNIGR